SASLAYTIRPCADAPPACRSLRRVTARARRGAPGLTAGGPLGNDEGAVTATGMKLSEFLRSNERRQAFGALIAEHGAWAVGQCAGWGCGVGVDRVGIGREGRLRRSVLQAYRVEIPARRETCRKCHLPFQLPDELSGYLIPLNDAHLAPKHLIIE